MQNAILNTSVKSGYTTATPVKDGTDVKMLVPKGYYDGSCGLKATVDKMKEVAGISDEGMDAYIEFKAYKGNMHGTLSGTSPSNTFQSGRSSDTINVYIISNSIYKRFEVTEVIANCELFGDYGPYTGAILMFNVSLSSGSQVIATTHVRVPPIDGFDFNNSGFQPDYFSDVPIDQQQWIWFIDNRPLTAQKTINISRSPIILQNTENTRGSISLNITVNRTGTYYDGTSYAGSIILKGKIYR